jgi:hypothetical protein
MVVKVISIMATTMATELGHLKNHVTYPASRAQVVAACNNMSDSDPANKEFVMKNLPEGNYRNAGEVLNALLTKV